MKDEATGRKLPLEIKVSSDYFLAFLVASIAKTKGMEGVLRALKSAIPSQNMPTLTITNANANYASGNIVVYVVNHNAGNYSEIVPTRPGSTLIIN